jgi:uncharacterized protein (TIGR03545 family)
MRSSLRWQILAPRLLLVVVALLAAQYGLGLAVRSLAINSSEAAVGARLEVGHARVWLLERQVVLSDLRVADPCQPAANVLDADRFEFRVATAPLLHKQTVVESGRVTGLCFEPKLRPNEFASEAPKWFSDNSDAAAKAWLAHLAERFQPDFVKRLDSVQKTDVLCSRWSTELAALDARGRELERRAAELQADFEAAQANPLRNDKFFAGLPATVAALKKDFAGLRADVDKQPELLEAERRAIVAARKKDNETLRDRLRLEPIDASDLSAYLIREQAVDSLDELVDWLRLMRRFVPRTPTQQPSPTRGEDVLFAGCRQAPDIVFRSLQLQGSTRIGGQPVNLRGLVTNYSTQPWLQNEPVRLKLATSGSLPLELQAIIDRTPGHAKDELLVDCRGIVLQQRVLGRPDQLEVILSPSVGSLQMNIQVEGEKLTGDVRLVQKGFHITPALRGSLKEVPLADSLQDLLGKVDSADSRLELSGTLNNPRCSLCSNLGPAVSEAMDLALRRNADQYARTILVEANRQVDERLAGIERQIAQYQSRLVAESSTTAAWLETAAVRETPRYRISAEQMGRRLPANSLLR